jgi:glycosyltransferase involved in cell wall biosynthesis
MMLKDEAETLEKTLQSILPLKNQVDLEIVIGVDRKSSDQTLKISKKYADVCFRFDWHNDFSEIRNLLISKSSGDWILISDGHEIWHGIDNIPEILLQVPNNIAGFAFLIRMNPAEGSSIGQQLRLVRNAPDVRYEGKIHNRLNIDTDSIATDKIWIYHDRKDKRRGERYQQRKEMHEQVFLKILKDNPDDPRANYYLGTFYLSQAAEKDASGIIKPDAKIDPVNLKKAITFIEKYISVSEFYEEKYLAKWYLAQAYFHLGDLETTKQIGYDMFEQMIEMPLGQEILGELYMYDFKENKNQRGLALAENWFKLARSKKVPFVSCFFPEPFFTWVPWERLTEIYSLASQKDPKRIIDAIYAAEKTLQYKDFPESRRQNLEKILLSWKELIGEDSDNSRSRDRQFDNVHTVNNGGNGALQNKGRSTRTKFDMAKLPEYTEKQKCEYSGNVQQ